MSIQHKEYAFPSHTGNTDIYVRSLAPENTTEIKGVVQLVHGMAEYTDRYLECAEYFCQKGYAFIMHDHAGHGKSVKSEEDYGWFAEKDGYLALVDDVYEVTEIAKKEFPGKKVILWGHSMGSFISRLFTAKYKNAVNAAVFCGTAGKNPAAGAGILIAKLICAVKGSKAKVKFLDNMAFGAYNKRFTGNTGFEWLSVEPENVKKYVADPLCGFLFSAGGFKDLFCLLNAVSQDSWFESVDKNLPIYLIAGNDDPVGNYGQGVKEVYDRLKDTSHNVKIKLYPGLRHEIHNEASRTEVYDDILAFADGIQSF